MIRGLPDGAVVLLDGLIASPAPEALVPHARRLRQVVLMHMPLGDGRERDVLAAATAVVTTSEWTRRRLEELYALQCVHVAEPGVDAADLAPGSAAGDALLCVAPVTRDKGHDVLLDALAGVESWRCAFVGSLDRDPAFADEVRRRADDRVHFAGPLTGAELERAYAAADLLVLPSHAETYGMVVTEALARGAAGRRVGRRRRDRSGRARARRHPAGTARPARRPGGPRRRAAGLARRRRAARAPAPGRPRAARVAARVAGDDVRRRGRARGSGAMSAVVSPEWLVLREPADAAARSTELADRLARHVSGPLVIHDLGGGSGSMGRWLAPRLPGPQHWVIHDRDPDLLALALAAPRTGSPSRFAGPTSRG